MPKMVLNEDSMTLVNLEGFQVVVVQRGELSNKTIGYRLSVYFNGGAGLAILAEFSDKELANQCQTALIHYKLDSKNKDVFKLSSVVKDSNIILPDSIVTETGISRIK